MSSENGFLPGYDGQFLGMNSQGMQNPGEFLGLNRNIQHPEPSTYLAGVQNDQMHSLVNMNSSVEGNRSAGGFGSEKIFRPIPLMGSRTIHVNDNSSDEVDPRFEEENSGDACGTKGKRDKDAPWHRMKWTDEIVRTLIQVVASVGEDGGSEVAEGAKQKPGFIKKGKWKTVSGILISKGYLASPQQCEDKFNDMNKRYKKLNDIIGIGVTCKVFKNPGLLEMMTHISPKAKETVKKLLSSKHLFYEEMCAYHNGQQIPHCSVPIVEGNSLKSKSGSQAAGQCSKEKDVSDNEEEDIEDDNESQDNLSDECGSQDRVVENPSKKRVGGYAGYVKLPFSAKLESLQGEVDKICNDPTMSKFEKKQRFKERMFQLEEERIEIQAKALEIGEQTAKWKSYYDKKDSELKMASMDNRRLMFENEEKALLLKKQKWN